MVIVVLFNGPPGAGKSTLADALERSRANVLRRNFKQPLLLLARSKARQLAGRALSDAEWGELLSRAKKDRPSALLGGQSPRELMISVSEHLMKMEFGADIFAQWFVQECTHWVPQLGRNGLIVADDVGFAAELEAVAAAPWVHAVLLVKIERAGAVWAGDSRSALTWKNELVIHNDDTVDSAMRQIERQLNAVQHE